MPPLWLAADPLFLRLSALDEATIYDAAERAAIHEYDAGMDRKTAERTAVGE